MWGQYISVLVLLCCVCVSAKLFTSSNYQDCSGSHGTTHSITIDPCTTEPCEFALDHTYNAIIQFTPTVTTQTATNAIYGKILGISIPWLGGYEPNECLSGGLTCPVNGGVQQTYTASVTVPTIAPKMGLEAKWMVKDDNGNAFICFTFDVVIV